MGPRNLEWRGGCAIKKKGTLRGSILLLLLLLFLVAVAVVVVLLMQLVRAFVRSPVLFKVI